MRAPNEPGTLDLITGRLLLGYARVSTDDQDLTNQRAELHAAHQDIFRKKHRHPARPSRAGANARSHPRRRRGDRDRAGSPGAQHARPARYCRTYRDNWRRPAQLGRAVGEQATKANPEMKSDIKAFHLYDLRAKAADDTSDDRGDQAASDLLGHESIKTTQRHYFRRGKIVAPTK